MSNRSVLVLIGPDLDLLGTREPEVYGTATLADVVRLRPETAERLERLVDGVASRPRRTMSNSSASAQPGTVSCRGSG